MQGLIPKGVSVRLPEAQERIERIKEQVKEIFSRWGFREVGTPIFEYYDEVYRLIDDSLNGALVKLIERETGRIIVLRPDFTPQVARIAATVLKEMPRPLRLYYEGSVFRWLGTSSGSKQISQIGLEIIGLDKPEACAELIGISEEVLEQLGVSSYTIALCNVSFIRELLSPFDAATRRKIAFALARKDKRELGSLLEGVEEKRRHLIMALPGLVGGPEIIGDIRRLYSDVGLSHYLDELEAVVKVLDGYGLLKNILIDLSEIRGMVYHRGFFFEVFVEGVGRRVAVGGRYDDLMDMYGCAEPAMGFAFNLEELYRAVLNSGSLPPDSPVDVLVVDLSKVKGKGVEIAKFLREKGKRVARDIIERSLEESLEYARVHGIGCVVVIRDELKKNREVEVFDPVKGTVKVVKEESL